MYKPEYKTGDRVVIKPWALMEEQYGLDSTGSIEVKATFTEKMEECLKGTDRVVTLGGRFLCGSFDGTGHLKGFEVSPDAILGYAFERGLLLNSSTNRTKILLNQSLKKQRGSC